jgi:NADH-quinone oxidoreductase subunit M
MNLDLLILIPMLSTIAVLFTRGLQGARAVSLLGAGVQAGLALWLMYAFNMERAAGNTASMLFGTTRDWFGSLNIHYMTGVDGISVAMIILTACVVLAGVLVSWNEERMSKEFFFLLNFLSLGAYGFFISMDLFMLFFFLEVAVIPKFLLIGIWGSGKKEYSAMKLALMLMGGSALVFVGLAGLYFSTSGIAGGNSFSIPDIMTQHIPVEVQRYFFPFAFAGFGIFTALFPFHTWVPDGHSSAPTAASMFLAGISMKLGGYGCLRVAVNLMPEAAVEYSTIIIVLSTIAVIYGAFATMMQTDLKYINAYSSVSHCGFVLLGIGMMTQTAIKGAVMQMVSHFYSICNCRSLFAGTPWIQRVCGRNDRICWVLGKCRYLLPFSNHTRLRIYSCHSSIHPPCCRKGDHGSAEHSYRPPFKRRHMERESCCRNTHCGYCSNGCCAVLDK